jgi:hypothetical protein
VIDNEIKKGKRRIQSDGIGHCGFFVKVDEANRHLGAKVRSGYPCRHADNPYR